MKSPPSPASVISQMSDLLTHVGAWAPRPEQVATGNLLGNDAAIDADLDNNWAVVTEAIQTILRRENYPEPYEALKELSRGKEGITEKSIHQFIDGLKITATVKKELKKIKPENYTGVPREL